MRKLYFFLLVALGANFLYADKCSDGLKYDFTFYGAPDKSYVVTKNTFKKYESNFPDGKLLNATVDIDAFSIDTSADLNNKSAKWPKSMASLRDNNTVNKFFKNFENNAGKINVKVIKIENNKMNLAFTMNGQTKEIPFDYKVEGDTLKANGKLDVLDFSVSNAWKAFTTVCKGFHHGKSWSEIDVFFQVPASCK